MLLVFAFRAAVISTLFNAKIASGLFRGSAVGSRLEASMPISKQIELQTTRLAPN